MAKKPPPTLADHVEAAERRAAPRAQARVSRAGSNWPLWLGAISLAIVLTAGALAYLRFKAYL